MDWLKRVGVLILVLVLPVLQAESATLDWFKMGELPIANGEEVGNAPRVTGTFLGVHNNALIIAGGKMQTPSHPVGSFQADIWVATRGAGMDNGAVAQSAARESRLNWHKVAQTLPSAIAHGASASHSLGVFIVGGTDGVSARSSVHLLRWNNVSLQVELLALPALPSVSVNGGAAIMRDHLYVMAGSNGESATGALYSLNLSNILTNADGSPVVVDGAVQFIQGRDGTDKPRNLWQKLPSLPEIDSQSLFRADMAVVAQSDGRVDHLYVLAPRQSEAVFQQSAPVSRQLWAYNPDTQSWTRKADVSVNEGKSGSRVAIGFGPSHILLLSADSGAHHPQAGMTDATTLPVAQFYNAITDAWTSYGEATAKSNQGVQADSTGVRETFSSVVKWDGDIVLLSSRTGVQHSAADIWSISVKGTVPSFGWQNMAVLTLYLLAVVMVGVYFMFKNSNTDDYFRGGQHIPWWAAACSIYATMLSSLTYVALPALVYRTDWLVYLGIMMILVVAPIAIYIAMPFFRQIDATSAYEYLSKRFNMPVRLFASALFTLFHVGRMGIVMALTALALAAVTPLEAWQCVLIMGVLCLIYCTLGGVEAVIWTDTVQTIVLLIGAVVCFIYILGGIDGGFSGFITRGMAGEKFTMVNWDFSLDSITTLSIWVIVLGGIGQNISSYTADQAVVQRYMVTSDERAAANSIWTNAIMAVPGALLFFCIGTGLYCFYQSQPEKLDPTIQIDQIFPTFIATELPVGIAGLIVAGIFAAAQSTVSTSMNSIATTLVTDFMRPFNACRSEAAYLNAARLLTFLMGVLGTGAALIFISPEIRSLMEQYFMVIGMFMGALGGLFVLGVTTRKANGWGAMIGLLAGVGLMFSVWRLEWADGYLFATIGILTCLLVGYLASLILPSPHRDLTGLTLHTMRAGRSACPAGTTA